MYLYGLVQLSQHVYIVHAVYMHTYGFRLLYLGLLHYYRTHSHSNRNLLQPYRQVLEAVDRGYRMPQPDNCPDPLYNIMLSSWKHEAEDRPTFESLKNLLEDYYVSAAEGAYKESN